MLVEIAWDPARFQAELKVSEKKLIAASVKAFNRMGLFVEAEAVRNAAINTGRMAGSIHKEPAYYDPATETVVCVVAADAAYSVYVEMGFQGHFVPFHIAQDLYYEAIRRWGWRVPRLEEIPQGRSAAGKQWLIPRGRRRPVWGVFVRGRAQPFLRPAVDKLFESGVYNAILKEEFERALS